jgi:hypothetical protein
MVEMGPWRSRGRFCQESFNSIVEIVLAFFRGEAHGRCRGKLRVTMTTHYSSSDLIYWNVEVPTARRTAPQKSCR